MPTDFSRCVQGHRSESARGEEVWDLLPLYFGRLQAKARFHMVITGQLRVIPEQCKKFEN